MQPSLVERLQKIQVVGMESLADFPKYSIEEMDEMKVDFGTKHLGRRYLDVWTGDQSWILWFLKHYSQSIKMSHRILVYYIECKIERAEMEGGQVLVTEPVPAVKASTAGLGKSFHAQSKAKAKAAPMLCHEVPIDQSEISSWDMGDAEIFEDMGAKIEQSQLVARMDNMENAINSILLHLEHMANAPHPQEPLRVASDGSQ